MNDDIRTNAMRVQIVIVNYKTADLVLDCLRSLVGETEPIDAAVWVMDNASQDGSAERIAQAIEQEHWDRWARMIALPKNGGFAYGNNAAIRPLLERPAPPEHVLLLNPDTVVRKGAIARLIEYLDLHPEVGIAGSRLEDPDGTPQRSAFRFPTVLSELEEGLRLGPISRILEDHLIAPPVRDDSHPTDWVAGASMLVRRGVFEQIGLMDEEYFLYYEEVDFCLRARRAGWRCDYVPASHVVHLVGQSSGVTDTRRVPKRRPDYWFESRRRYFVKNHGVAYAALADAAWALSFATYRVRSKLQGKPDTDPPMMLRDFLRHSVLLGGRR